MQPRKTDNIVYLSTYPPRECGIATFTRDLVEAVQKKYNPALKPRILAINNDVTDIYTYDKQVISHITASNIDEYINLAKEINATDSIKIIHIQHEFGIFGGDWGNHLIPFFQVIEKPVVITFHTILPNPDRSLFRIVQFILQHAQAIIVMNRLSKDILKEQYAAADSQVFVIPHGIPYVASPNGSDEKKKLGIQNHLVLSTFGLLSKGKGIEYALRALPGVVKQVPDLLYLIIGITHPVVRNQEGEEYRNFLHSEVQRLGLKDHVRFYNKYLSLEEIINFLKATDIYVSPTLAQEQSVSGTLSYALGCGTPVVSTDSLYAKSIVTNGTGTLVPPKSPEAIQQALIDLCRDSKHLKEMRKTAFAETRHMTWPNVALGHFNLYQKYARIIDEHKLPPIILDHIQRLTDTFGIIQFAKHTEPDRRYGYALDDNARALMVTARTLDVPGSQSLKLLKIYLNFMKFTQKAGGSFENLVNSSRKVIRHDFSDDAQGRALWALGYTLAQENLPEDIKKRITVMFKKTLPSVKKLKSPRAIAFSILGLYYYNQEHPTIQNRNLLQKLADLQIKQFQETSSKDWLWFEDSFTYSNSKLPESLFYAYMILKDKKYLRVAEKSLQFLIDITFEEGERFSPIGQNGWYLKDGKRAYFDQQPEDASSMVQTLLAAYEATKKEQYYQQASKAFQWFLGQNHLNQMVYDETTGGCYDGLGQHSLNMNQGAESTISYLLARLALEDYKETQQL
jgi:glycosyltransferase involved in cell wall biosynthesis